MKTSEGTFIIIIISKLNDSQKNEKESILSDNIEEEKPSSKEKVIVLSKEEIPIYEQIKEFRENPKKFLDKKFSKIKKTKRIWKFYSLEKLPELTPDKELCDIAKEELKKFLENDNYNKYQIGEDFKSKLNDKFSQNDVGLIALEDIDNFEQLIPKIIINDEDSEKKGRNILINP